MHWHSLAWLPGLVHSDRCCSVLGVQTSVRHRFQFLGYTCRTGITESCPSFILPILALPVHIPLAMCEAPFCTSSLTLHPLIFLARVTRLEGGHVSVISVCTSLVPAQQCRACSHTLLVICLLWENVVRSFAWLLDGLHLVKSLILKKVFK